MTRKNALFTMLICSTLYLTPNIGLSHDHEEYTFSSFGQKNLSELDINKLTKSRKITAGHYLFDIYLNEKFLTQKDVSLIEYAEKTLKVCIDAALFNLLSLNPSAFEIDYDENNCVSLSNSIKNSYVDLDSSNLRVYISIPQAYFNNRPKGYIAEELLESGITALKLDYNVNSYYQNTNTTEMKDDTYGSFMSLNSSVNIMGWRLYNFSTARWQNDQYNGWNSIRTYAQREVLPLKSQLTIGETFTSGELFSSIGFKGLSLSTDHRMLPTSQAGYAPVIRGVARSQARVTIEQNGYDIYEIDVPAGEFSIEDLYATGYDGDIRMTLTI